MLGISPISSAAISSLANTNVTLPVTGLGATASVGSVGLGFSLVVNVTGLEAVVSLGNITVIGTAIVLVDGLEAQALTNGALVWSEISVTQNANWTRIDDFDPCSC
jgi:hypothetical protein